MNSGIFIDLGFIHVTSECLKRCCEIESCDLVYMISEKCYAVNCFSSEMCEAVSAEPFAADEPSVFYVTRKGKSIFDKGKHNQSHMTKLFRL